ncbi:proto-oncogene c-Rel-like [Rhopilema esculentum]|uniref:proto-oncogene c-Rel-like n=1 Tax=Rhopilema esculentum TaxID=499914 RepID=UPI0031DA0F31
MDDMPPIDDAFLDQILNVPYDYQTEGEPYIEILKQPKQRGYRFRYISEGQTHGGITADNTNKGNKQYPSIHIGNYKGRASVCITLVTADDPVRVHPYNLVGKDVKNGMFHCDETKEQWVRSFPNLGIQNVTKKDLVRVMHEKLCQQFQLNQLSAAKDNSEITQSFDIAHLLESFGGNDEPGLAIDESVALVIAEEEKRRLLIEAEKISKEIDLSAVRLCFQAFLLDESGQITKTLPAVLSQPIYDQKAAHAGQLRICRISKTSSSVAGGEEVFLLCDKVQKEHIAVRLYQEDSAGKLTWEGFGKFSQADVHKQSAIVFRTPPYVDKAIQKPIEVKLQLKRSKDNACSEPVPFIYQPVEYDQYKIGEKRRKGLPENIDEMLQSAAKQPKTSLPPSSTVSQAPGAGQGDFSPRANSSFNSPGIKFFQPDHSRR